MSTIASLLSMIGEKQPRPWDIATRSQNEAETGLLTLADLKAKQQAEQLMLEQIKTNPDVARQLFGGGPVLGSLQTAPAGPPGGALTQQTFGPTGAPAPAQVVPGGQDLSQFATQGGPPQSVLGSLGPAGQPQMQAPQNPALEMARTNPRAALMLQQQMEGRQDAQMKRHEQNLKLGAATLGYVGQQAQGVTDQAGLDALRSDLQSQGLGKYAAQLPQLYSKEAMQPFIVKALDVGKSLELQVQTLAAQAELKRAQMAGRVPTTDQYLKALGVAPGAETDVDMQKALAWQQRDEVARQAAHGTGQIVMTPGGAIRVGKDNQVEVIKGPDGQPIYDKPTAAAEAAASYGDRAQRAHDNAVKLEDKGITPTTWSKVGDALPFGLGNYLVGEDQQGYRQAVSQFGLALLRKESGAAIGKTEYDMIEKTFFPQPGDSKKTIADKRVEREAIIKNLQAEGKAAGRAGTQAPPPSQGSTGGKPVSQMSAEETRAEIAAIKARGGR